MEDVLAGSQPPTGRILVKLKLPKMPTPAEEESTSAAAMPAAASVEDGVELKKHYCTECDRSFSSGKALGGHMSSAHVQASKDQSTKKLKSKTKSYRRASEEILCSECGKEFCSMKALFGHMRCHPERNYRGMNSPIKPQINDQNPNFPKLGIESGQLDPAVSWCRRGKRGCVPTPKEEDAFLALIMLHQGDPRPPLTNHSQENDSGSTSKKPRVSSDDDEECTEGNNETRSKHPFLLGNRNSSPDFGAMSDDEFYLSAMVELKNGPRIEEAQIPIPISSPNPTPTPKTELCIKSLPVPAPIIPISSPNLTPKTESCIKSLPISLDKYTCNICNKSFPTHQALGGHRSSHRKLMMSIVNTEDRIEEVGNGNIINNSSSAAGGGGGGSPLGSRDNEGDAEVSGEKLSSSHVCKICNKDFASGQALGGHMRSHFEESNGVRSSSDVQKMAMAFDLNKMPEEEEED